MDLAGAPKHGSVCGAVAESFGCPIKETVPVLQKFRYRSKYRINFKTIVDLFLVGSTVEVEVDRERNKKENNERLDPEEVHRRRGREGPRRREMGI